MKIKIYIDGLSIGKLSPITGSAYRQQQSVHPESGAVSDGIAVDDPIMFSEDCIKAIKVVRRFATEKGLEMKIYDLSRAGGEFSAWLNRIRIIPTVIIGKEKIEGVPTFEELENATFIIG